MPGDAHVAYFALGGTISMTAAPTGGVVARLVATSWSPPSANCPVEVRVHDAAAVPSASLTFDHVLDVVDAAEQAVADGAVGIVLSQGTDSLEETAFLIDCVWRHPEPFVITGAMRNPTLAGADGPANLLAAHAGGGRTGRARPRGARDVPGRDPRRPPRAQDAHDQPGDLRLPRPRPDRPPGRGHARSSSPSCRAGNR